MTAACLLISFDLQECSVLQQSRPPGLPVAAKLGITLSNDPSYDLEAK